MELALIKNFTCKCSTCNTSIQFEVPELSSISKMVELSTALNKLICPKCSKSLSSDASEALDTIKKYNEAAHDLMYTHTNISVNSTF